MASFQRQLASRLPAYTVLSSHSSKNSSLGTYPRIQEPLGTGDPILLYFRLGNLYFLALCYKCDASNESVVWIARVWSTDRVHRWIRHLLDGEKLRVRQRNLDDRLRNYQNVPLRWFLLWRQVRQATSLTWTSFASLSVLLFIMLIIEYECFADTYEGACNPAAMRTPVTCHRGDWCRYSR